MTVTLFQTSNLNIQTFFKPFPHLAVKALFRRTIEQDRSENPEPSKNLLEIKFTIRLKIRQNNLERFSRMFFYSLSTCTVIRKEEASHRLGGEANLTEPYGWLFVDNVPLLYDRRRVARQLQVETWLYLAQLVGELKMEDLDTNKHNAQPAQDYVV